MDFDVNRDFGIFDAFLKKRPEVLPDTLKNDLTRYYLPYSQKLIQLKQQKGIAEGILVGVSAIQGTGKTTQGEILETLLDHFGHSTISRSIDDHYITHRELTELRNNDPRFIRRGVTHDISLAIQDLKDLQQMQNGQAILVSGYDKGAHHGDGDRFRWVNPVPGIEIKVKVLTEGLTVNKEPQTVQALQLISVSLNGQEIPLPENMGSDIPVLSHFLSDSLVSFLQSHIEDEITVTMLDDGNVQFSSTTNLTVNGKDLPNGWRIVSQKPDFIFYDGWMLGARRVQDESVFDSGLPALETEDAREFAKFVNKKLDNYLPLWEMFEFLTVLYVPNYKDSLQWRDHAEESLRAKGEGMTHEQIQEFVYYFWRSVHPGIHIKNLAQDGEHTNQVVVINDDHTVKEVLSPEEVKVKYSDNVVSLS